MMPFSGFLRCRIGAEETHACIFMDKCTEEHWKVCCLDKVFVQKVVQFKWGLFVCLVKKSTQSGTDWTIVIKTEIQQNSASQLGGVYIIILLLLFSAHQFLVVAMHEREREILVSNMFLTAVQNGL